MKKGIMELLKMKLMMELVMDSTLIYIVDVAEIKIYDALIQMVVKSVSFSFYIQCLIEMEH